MDMILAEKDIFKKAAEKWCKIVPAITSYSESFNGKSDDALKKLREDNQSMHGIGLIIFLGVIINFNATLSQTDDADECAFLLLVNILGKKDSKTKQEAFVYAYHKCKVLINF